MSYLIIAEFLNCSQDDIISIYRLVENGEDLESFDMLTESLVVIKGTLKGINRFLTACSNENHNSKLVWYSHNDVDPKIVHDFWCVYSIFVTAENYIETDHGNFVCDENLIIHIDKQGNALQRHFNNSKSPEIFGIEVILETLKKYSNEK